MGDGHDRATNALIVIAGYNCLVQEETDTITLCPSLPSAWWKDTPQKIQADHLITKTGSLSIDLEFSNQRLTLKIEQKGLRKKVQIKVPHAIKTLKIDGSEKSVPGTLIPLSKTTKNIDCLFES